MPNFYPGCFITLLLPLFLGTCGRAKPSSPAASLQLDTSESRQTVRLGNRPILSYNWVSGRPDSLPEYYRRSGYLHPVHSPAGRVVSDGFPVGHTHQNGVFSAWTKTRFRG